jgi:hypothetical protein
MHRGAIAFQNPFRQVRCPKEPAIFFVCVNIPVVEKQNKSFWQAVGALFSKRRILPCGMRFSYRQSMPGKIISVQAALVHVAVKFIPCSA